MLTDEFRIVFDESSASVRIWPIVEGKAGPVTAVPFAKLRVQGLLGSAEAVGIRLVARSLAIQKLFGIGEENPDPTFELIAGKTERHRDAPKLKRKR